MAPKGQGTDDPISRAHTCYPDAQSTEHRDPGTSLSWQWPCDGQPRETDKNGPGCISGYRRKERWNLACRCFQRRLWEILTRTDLELTDKWG